MDDEFAPGRSCDFELATWGEVISAFRALRSMAAQRNGRCGTRPPCDTELPEVLCPPQASGSPVNDEGYARVRPKALSVQRLGNRRRGGGRCHCGTCRVCLDNARWERIFREKFATAEYYRSEIRVRYPSPLSGI
jgi:hypothetical protein